MRNLNQVGKSLSAAVFFVCLALFLSACHGNTSEPRETRVYVVGPLQTIDDTAIDAVIRKLQTEVKDKDETTILIIANPDCLFKDVSALVKRIKSEGYPKIRLQAPPEPAGGSRGETTGKDGS